MQHPPSEAEEEDEEVSDTDRCPSPIPVELSTPLCEGQSWDDDSDLEEMRYQRKRRRTSLYTPWVRGATTEATVDNAVSGDTDNKDNVHGVVSNESDHESSAGSVMTELAPRQPPTNPDWCFLCEFMYNPQEPGQGQMQTLMKYIDQKFCQVRAYRFCLHVQQIYNNHLRPYTPNEPHWHKHTIYHHVAEHAATPMNAAHVCDSKLREVLRVCGDEMIVRNPSDGRLEVVESKVGLYLRVRNALGVKRKRGKNVDL